MLELTGGIGLGVDVGDLFQLERPLHGDGVLAATTEEQAVVLVGELLGQGLDLLGQRQALLDTQRQGLQRLDKVGLGGGAQVATAVTDGGHQHQQAGQLGGERLGGGDANLGTGPGHKGQVRFSHQGGARHVADGERAHVTGLLGQAQGGQGVGGLAALGQGHQQTVGAHHGLAIAEL